jgi:hypothetical protein
VPLAQCLDPQTGGRWGQPDSKRESGVPDASARDWVSQTLTPEPQSRATIRIGTNTHRLRFCASSAASLSRRVEDWRLGRRGTIPPPSRSSDISLLRKAVSARGCDQRVAQLTLPRRWEAAGGALRRDRPPAGRTPVAPHLTWLRSYACSSFLLLPKRRDLARESAGCRRTPQGILQE